MQETWVPSLGWEDPLEKEMATHSTILAWKIPWMEEPVAKSRTRLSDFTFFTLLSFFTQPVGFQFSNQGSNLGPLQQNCQVPITGLPGNSQVSVFKALL